jgi:sugar phosphate isomerase/epimerase
MSQLDIRIGTLVSMDKAASHIPQILPHGFESFALTCWQKIGPIDLATTAKQVLAAIGDNAVISAVGVFGNPLQDPNCAKDIARMIDSARLFNCDIVSGFAGAIEGKPLPESMPAFKRVWFDLVKRAQDNGVRIAFENCDMAGTWESPAWNIAHSPAAWEMIFNELPFENVGLEWEPCHQMCSLVDPIPQLRQWVKRIFHLHGKDATIDWNTIGAYGIRGGKTYAYHRTPGFGDSNWTDIISILRMNKYIGAIDIEGFHDPVYRDDLEMTGQVHGLNYLKNCRGGAYIPNPT